MKEYDENHQRITLRIPKELHSELMKEARSKTRSMNAEIVHRLQSSFGSAETKLTEQAITEMIGKVLDEKINAVLKEKQQPLRPKDKP